MAINDSRGGHFGEGGPPGGGGGVGGGGGGGGAFGHHCVVDGGSLDWIPGPANPTAPACPAPAQATRTVLLDVPHKPRKPRCSAALRSLWASQWARRSVR